MRTGLVLGGTIAMQCSRKELPEPTGWDRIRAQFPLTQDYIDMAALLIASHPEPVRKAIERYRRELDLNPVVSLQEHNRKRQDQVLRAAAGYLGADPADIALTDSTTMGLGLVYNGLDVGADDEILTTDEDYYVTHESLRLASKSTGVRVRKIPLFRSISTVSQEEMVDNLVSSIGPDTRALALTWVHSSTGLKIPVRLIAEALRDFSKGRAGAGEVLLCLDAVHGFGVEDVEAADLGCDFFVAGCHKWLFGPRGTGIIWGSKAGWRKVIPTVPTFMDPGTREAWIEGHDVTGPTTGRRMSPGGFKPFEHQWAVKEAFEFHQSVGKARVAARTHELARQLKEGLASMRHVKLYTPMSDDISAGIVCFDLDGLTPPAVVERLRERRIIATVTPYATPHTRLTPSIRNSPEEIDSVLREIHALA